MADMSNATKTERGYNIGITALSNGVRSWAKKLEAQGFEIEIDVFKTGQGGDEHYGPSTVELTLEKEYTDGSTGELCDFLSTVTFVAGGYGGLDERHAIGGRSGWRAMKAEGEKRLHSERDWKAAAQG
jgi:hypothetical protein